MDPYFINVFIWQDLQDYQDSWSALRKRADKPNRLRRIGIYSTLVVLRVISYLHQFQTTGFFILFPLKADCIFSVSSRRRIQMQAMAGEPETENKKDNSYHPVNPVRKFSL